MPDPFELNILGVQNLVGSNTNKSFAGGLGDEEEISSEQLDALSIDLTDDELLELRDQ